MRQWLRANRASGKSPPVETEQEQIEAGRLRPISIHADLADGGDLRFNLGQSGLESLPARRIRRSLRQDVFALQIERLPVALAGSAFLRNRPPLVVVHRTGAFEAV